MSLQFANIQAPILHSFAAVAATTTEPKKDAVPDNHDRPRKAIFRNGAMSIINDHKGEGNFYDSLQELSNHETIQQSRAVSKGNDDGNNDSERDDGSVIVFDASKELGILDNDQTSSTKQRPEGRYLVDDEDDGCGGYHPLVAADTYKEFQDLIRRCLHCYDCPLDFRVGYWSLMYGKKFSEFPEGTRFGCTNGMVIDREYDNVDELEFLRSCRSGLRYHTVEVYWKYYEAIDCPYPNAEIGCWDTSEITDMRYAFHGKASFNLPIDSWNTAAVTDMSSMFSWTSSFNQPIGSWDTSSVTDMSNMFWNDIAFNQAIDSWNTSKVTNMREMFRRAEAFNQPVDSWDTSMVTSMYGMFLDAYSFNQCISTWATQMADSISMGSLEEDWGSIMLEGTACKYTNDPNPSVSGPWCQDEKQCSSTDSPTNSPIASPQTDDNPTSGTSARTRLSTGRFPCFPLFVVSVNTVLIAAVATMLW